MRRLRILEERVTQRKAQGPAPVDVLRQFWRQARARDAPYEELCSEKMRWKAKALRESYDSDRSPRWHLAEPLPTPAARAADASRKSVTMTRLNLSRRLKRLEAHIALTAHPGMLSKPEEHLIMAQFSNSP